MTYTSSVKSGVIKSHENARTWFNVNPQSDDNGGVPARTKHLNPSGYLDKLTKI